jgi:hypothetical protein
MANKNDDRSLEETFIYINLGFSLYESIVIAGGTRHKLQQGYSP